MRIFKNKLLMTFATLLFAVTLVGGYSIDSSAASKVYAAADTSVDTTEGNGNSGDINDFYVHMNDDGTISTSMDDKNDTNLWQFIFDNGKTIVLGISGIATIVFAIMLIINFASISAAKGNPQELSKGIKGVVWTLIATAGCGAVFVILALAWGFFR